MKQIALIGTGSRMHSIVRGLLESPRLGSTVTIGALCDTNREAAESLAQNLPETCPKPRIYTDHRKLLACENDITWTVIASPTYAHPEHAIDAMRAGRHVFCEKPLAHKLPELHAMHQVQRETGRFFMTGFVLRYTPMFRRAVEILESGELGSIISTESNETLHFQHGASIMYHPWRMYTRLGAGHLNEKCVHDIDLINRVARALPTRVASFGGRNFFVPANRHLPETLAKSAQGRTPYLHRETHANPFETDTDILDNQVVILEYDNGMHAAFHTNRNAAIRERRMLIYGERGALRFDFQTRRLDHARIGWEETVHTEDLSELIRGSHSGGDVAIGEALLTSVETDQPPAIGAAPGLIATATCHLADQALAQNTIIDLRPTWKEFGFTNEDVLA